MTSKTYLKRLSCLSLTICLPFFGSLSSHAADAPNAKQLLTIGNEVNEKLRFASSDLDNAVKLKAAEKKASALRPQDFPKDIKSISSRSKTIGGGDTGGGDGISSRPITKAELIEFVQSKKGLRYLVFNLLLSGARSVYARQGIFNGSIVPKKLNDEQKAFARQINEKYFGKDPSSEGDERWDEVIRNSKDTFETLNTINFVVKDGPCMLDVFSPRDGVADLRNHSICFSYDRLKQKVNAYTYRQKILELAIHELGHFRGLSEDEAVFVQTQVSENYNLIPNYLESVSFLSTKAADSQNVVEGLSSLPVHLIISKCDLFIRNILFNAVYGMYMEAHRNNIFSMGMSFYPPVELTLSNEISPGIIHYHLDESCKNGTLSENEVISGFSLLISSFGKIKRSYSELLNSEQ